MNGNLMEPVSGFDALV